MASLDRLLYLLTTPVTNDKNNKEDQRKKRKQKTKNRGRNQNGCLGASGSGSFESRGVEVDWSFLLSSLKVH